MSFLFRILINSTLLLIAAFTVPAWSIQHHTAKQSTVKQLTVNELAAKPDNFIGKVTITGRVAAVTSNTGFTLIDNTTCTTCTTECKNIKKIPLRWSGASPKLKDIVLAQGIWAKTTTGFTFTADKVTKQSTTPLLSRAWWENH